ncbi:MAG: ATP-binding protein, partial [Desulfurococcaceae archaeon]
MSIDSDISLLHEEAERLLDEIARTRETIKKLREHQITLQSELKKLREDKIRLLEKIRSIKANMRKLKEERRELLKELKNTVAERRKAINELKALKELINEKTTIARALAKEAKLPVSAIKKKIDEIEWKIQTTALTVEEEAKWIEKLRAYMSLYEKALAATKSREEVLELRAIRESLKVEIRNLSEKIKQLKD